MSNKKVEWNSSSFNQAVNLLINPGNIIVSPTKVGYIIMGTDKVGLEKKFQVKKRNKNKPGVVLCSSIEQLTSLAEMTPEILSFYQKHWQDDILLGCILPWKEEAKKLIPEESKDFIMDKRSTSCFVIKFGKPSEQIASQLWEKHRKLCFASSANPSGKGNKGMISGVGYDIEEGADLLICADDYVASIQPGKSVDTRYEQGVMVSMVDNEGNLIPQQNCQRKISPCPIVIRKGLDIDKIMINLSDYFLSWDYRQGTYY